MKGDYDIIEIKKDNINLIKNLWEKNRIFHQNKTSNFSYQYSNLNFDERMNNIFNSKNIKYYKISAIIPSLSVPITILFKYLFNFNIFLIIF
ncbi:hypothetical protein FNCV3_07150 [Fusobacterium nucleatum]|nr:hypothetical protein FNCV3_07150 [Fusobacterium nucleatum]BEP05660.1 hypothetical protein FNSV3_10070 [Fusobacterium nucleatum]